MSNVNQSPFCPLNLREMCAIKAQGAEDQRDNDSGRTTQPGMSPARNKPRDPFPPSFGPSFMSVQTISGK